MGGRGAAPSRLEAARRARGVKQQDLASAIGIGVSTYRRLERKQIPGPPLAYFVNCAMVLDVPITSLIDDEYLLWTQLTDDKAKTSPSAPPEDPQKIWNPFHHANPKPPPA